MALGGDVLDNKYEQILRPAYDAALRISYPITNPIKSKMFDDLVKCFRCEIRYFSNISTVKYHKKLRDFRGSLGSSALMVCAFIFPIMSAYHVAPALLKAWNAHRPLAEKRLKSIGVSKIPNQAAEIFVLRAFLEMLKWKWAEFSSIEGPELPRDEVEAKEHGDNLRALELMLVPRDVCKNEADQLGSQLIGVQRYSEAGLSGEGRRLFNAIGMVVRFPDDEKPCENLAHLVKGYTNYLIRLRVGKA